MILYNKKIEDSITYKALTKIRDKKYNLQVLIEDNSTQELENKNKRLPSNFVYKKMEGNVGLSKAYNIAIDNLINKFNKSDVLVLLDDDTYVSKEYFDLLYGEIQKYPNVDIFSPIVVGQDGIIYSPNNANFLKNHLISKREDIKLINNYNAISSGLAIRLSVLENYRFDERLFLDEVDQKFCDDQRKRRKKFKAINIIINQNFHQRGENLNSQKLWPRFKIRIKDIMMYGRIKGNAYIILGWLKVNLLGVQFARKTKDKSFITKTIKYSFNCLRNVKNEEKDGIC